MVFVQSFFFKVVWKELDQFIVRSINYGELSVTQKEGIITCIQKDNKPRRFLIITDQYHYSTQYTK